MDRAACRNTGESFVVDAFEATHETERLAWTRCHRCPVASDCLAFAREHRCIGLWGGVLIVRRGQDHDYLQRAAS